MNLGEIFDYKLSMPSRLIKIVVSGLADKAVAPRAKSTALAEMSSIHRQVGAAATHVSLWSVRPLSGRDTMVSLLTSAQLGCHEYSRPVSVVLCGECLPLGQTRRGGGPTRSVGVLKGQTKGTLAGSEDSPRNLLGRAQPPVFGALGAWPCARSCRIINRRSHINRSGFSDNQSAAAGGARINKAFYL